MVFHWRLSESKSPEVSSTHLNILADLINAVIWMASTHPPISKSSNPFINPFVTVPRAPITIGIKACFMFHSFFFSILCIYPSFQFLSILLCGQPRQQSPQFCKFSFLLIIIRSGRLAEIRWSQSSLCVSFSRTDVEICIYHLFVWSNLNFWHNSQWITLPTQSCLVSCSFCANLLLSLIMWLLLSSLSLHNLHLLFCCVYSCSDMIGFYGVVLCFYQERFRFFLKVSLSRHIHVFLCEMSLISRLKRP